jgi:hypothetical protein
LKKFRENLNTAVLTTRFVIEGLSDILHIFHYEDGSWQFSGPEENLLEQDYRIVSLGEIIELDDTITELAGMPINSQANRVKLDSPWRIADKN